MIAYLQGTVLKKMQKSAIILAGDIGYLVHVPVTVEENLKEKDEVELYIHTRVREDDISLYGFETQDQLDFFKLLLGVNGVGAKLATDILSQKTDTVKSAILNKDTAFLSKIPGIGKKTAERIIVELKNKIDPINLMQTVSGQTGEIDGDAVIALLGLGYQRYEINRILRTIPNDIRETEKIVTYFLQNV